MYFFHIAPVFQVVKLVSAAIKDGKLVAALLAVIVLTATTSACLSKDMTKVVEGYQSKLATHAPVGTSAADIVQYLNQEGIEVSDYADAAPQLVAIVRNVKKSWFTSTSLQLFFTFDQDRLLTDTKIEEVHTGP